MPVLTRPSRIAPVRDLFHPGILSERLRESFGGHPADQAHREHVAAAVEWIARAQDSTGSGGIARGYALRANAYFGWHGWEPAYPETTGYIIPTLYAAARYLDRPELALRARHAATWECDVQLDCGAVRGGVIGQPEAPVVFNTGQVLFGWLAAYLMEGDERFAEAARRASAFLVATMDSDGLWSRGGSPFTMTDVSLYDARVAWGLAEAGTRLGHPRFRDAAARALHAVAKRQRHNGWIPDCCLNDPQRPLLHTIAYAIRGLLEGGRVLGDARLVDGAASAAAAIAADVDTDGRLSGRYDDDWGRAASWSCLTGQAQMAGVWLRLAEITGQASWLEPVPRVLKFLKTTQNRVSRDDGLRGGIKGSFPLDGEYGPYETLSWAAKFFVDALIRDDRQAAGTRTAEDDPLALA